MKKIIAILSILFCVASSHGASLFTDGTDIVTSGSKILVERPLWTPAELTNVIQWLDGTDSSVILTNVAGVTQWTDKSPAGNDAVQTNASEQPSVSTLGTGGAISFDGSDMLDINIPLTNSSYSLFMTCTTSSIPAYVYSTESVDSSPAILSRFASRDFEYYGSEPRITIAEDCSVCPAIIGFTTTVGAGAFVYFNGEFIDTSVINQSDFTAESFKNIGSAKLGVNPFNGEIGDIVLVEGIVSESERQKIEGALLHGRGMQANLDADHPYRYRPPRIGD